MIRQNLAGLRSWLNETFPVHLPDADEPLDAVEATDYTPVVDVVMAAQTTCLGFACPKKSSECDFCGLSEAPEPEPDVSEYHHQMEVSRKKKAPIFQSGHAAWMDQYSLASNCRGGRARSELRLSARMGF